MGEEDSQVRRMKERKEGRKVGMEVVSKRIEEKEEKTKRT